MDKDTTIQQIKDVLAKFRDDRDWKQFHDPKNLAAGIAIEAGELQENFLWKTNEEIQEKLKNDPEYFENVKDELADVFNFCINFANTLGVELSEISLKKIEKNGSKYPVEKARGNATKYTKL